MLNKCDQVPGLAALPLIGGGVRISAKTGEGLPQLLTAVEEALPVTVRRTKLCLPFAQAGLAARVRQEGTVLAEEYTAEGLVLEAFVGPALWEAVAPYVQGKTET